MSYVSKNLLPGETITCTGQLHWIIYLRPLLIIALGIALIATSPFAPNLPKLWMWGAAAIVVGALAAIPAMLNAWSTELVVTSVRIIAKHGLVSRRTTEMLHKKVESLAVEQSIVGRILGYGTLVIHGTGGAYEAITNIARPLEFRNAATAAQSVT